MIIIRHVDTLRRLRGSALAHAASVRPVAVVTGARQTGKSTLVREPAPAGARSYFTLDDLDTLERCRPGLWLHTGDTVEWLSPGVLAAPWWKVL